MAFTYDAALTSSKDRVRFLLQDTTNTTAAPAQLDDGEILWALSTEANIYMAAALCADTMMTRARGLSSKTVGSLSLSWGSRWQDVASRLRARGSTHQNITAGGVLVADRDAIWEDSTLLRPSHFSTLHQNPEQLPVQRTADLTDE